HSLPPSRDAQFFSSYCYDPPPALHSFPTRRSSDLSSNHIVASSETAQLVSRRHVEQSVNIPFYGIYISVFKIIISALWQPFIWLDRKSTRLNSSHVKISYAVFCS